MWQNYLARAYLPLVRETRTRLQQKAVSTQKGQAAGCSRNRTKFESQKVIIGNIGFTRTRPYPFPKVAVSRTERAWRGLACAFPSKKGKF